MICWDISLTGNIVAVGFESGLVRIFKSKIPTKPKAKEPTNRGAFDKSSSTGKKVDDEQVKDKTESLYGHRGPVYCLSISHDEKFVISGSLDSNVRLWCLIDGIWLVVYKAHSAPVWDLKFFTYSNFFASCSADSLAKMWTISKFEPVRIFAHHEVDVIKVEFVPKYKSLVTASIDFTMVIWNIIKGQKMIVIETIL
jgi:transcription initiation factor TFIID subunit 5